MSEGHSTPDRLPDWESFYCSYRKPGYVSGFEITTKLGGGMFGLVFKARKQSIGKDYAIKFLKVDDSEVRRAVLLELEQVRYFAQVDHPNLVSIEDRGEVDGIPYLVMAYAGSETLRDLLPGDAASRPRLLQFFVQACRGVAALHERSLVHFDLKPANVFLKGSVARVGDYGLSKLVTHSRGSLSMGRGTPYYMAPEMLQRRGDHRSDVYSLGVMLFEMLTGDVPFKGESEWEVLRLHETGKLSFPDHVGARERAVVERCMHKDPAQRFQSVHELLAVFGQTGPASKPAAVIAGAATAASELPVDAAELVAGAGTPRAERARRGVLRPLWMVVLCAIAVATFVRQKSVHAQHRARGVTVYRTATAPVVIANADTVVTENGVRAEIRRLASAIDRAARRRTGSSELRPIDEQRVSMPAALPLYREELTHLVDTTTVSPVVLAQLERLGFPIVIAGVAWLQEHEYRSQTECAAASRIMQFLQQATAVDGLAVEPPLCSPDNATVRRYRAAAEAWRRLVEQFCRDDAAFREMLTATGKGGVDRRNN